MKTKTKPKKKNTQLSLLIFLGFIGVFLELGFVIGMTMLYQNILAGFVAGTFITIMTLCFFAMSLGGKPWREE